MKKIDLFYGMILGFFLACIGIYLFITVIAKYEFVEGYLLLKRQGQVGKVIALGSILNLFAFFFLLKINKELMARGVVLATLILTVVTLFA